VVSSADAIAFAMEPDDVERLRATLTEQPLVG
jgi:hypothetical protein